MLRQLLSSHDNGQSMVLYPEGMKHAPTVVIVTWQRSEHGYLSHRYETRSVSCHRLMTTVRAWLFISKIWTMLRQLLSSHDNCQSMVIYPYDMNHAPSVVIVWWQRSEHGNISLRCEPCSVSCHHLVTTVRAWYYIPKVWTMLCQLLSSSDNGQSMDISLSNELCSVSCHRLMTMVRAWLFISKIWTMLRQLLSSHDNGQSMGFHS